MLSAALARSSSAATKIDTISSRTPESERIRQDTWTVVYKTLHLSDARLEPPIPGGARQ